MMNNSETFCRTVNLIVSTESDNLDVDSNANIHPLDTLDAPTVNGPRVKRRRRKRSKTQTGRIVGALGQLASLLETMLIEQAEIKAHLLASSASPKNPSSSEEDDDDGGDSTSATISEVELRLAQEVERLRAELELARRSQAEAEPSSDVLSGLSSSLAMLQDALSEAERTIESLREENSRLQSLVMVQQSPATATARPPLNALSWDEQKKRLMEEGDEDDAASNDSNPQQFLVEEVRKWKELLQASQSELEQRDALIAELQQQLASNLDRPPESPEVNPQESMLAADEIIQQEREKLRTLQAEMEEKLRKAEIDLSLERARLARERQTIEELQQQHARNGGVAENSTPTKKRKWLSSLGLDGK